MSLVIKSSHWRTSDSLTQCDDRLPFLWGCLLSLLSFCTNGNGILGFGISTLYRCSLFFYYRKMTHIKYETLFIRIKLFIRPYPYKFLVTTLVPSTHLILVYKSFSPPFPVFLSGYYLLISVIRSETNKSWRERSREGDFPRKYKLENKKWYLKCTNKSRNSLIFTSKLPNDFLMLYLFRFRTLTVLLK